MLLFKRRIRKAIPGMVIPGVNLYKNKYHNSSARVLTGAKWWQTVARAYAVTRFPALSAFSRNCVTTALITRECHTFTADCHFYRVSLTVLTVDTVLEPTSYIHSCKSTNLKMWHGQEIDSIQLGLVFMRQKLHVVAKVCSSLIKTG